MQRNVLNIKTINNMNTYLLLANAIYIPKTQHIIIIIIYYYKKKTIIYKYSTLDTYITYIDII